MIIKEGYEKREVITLDKPETRKPLSNSKINEAINIIKELIEINPTIASECGGDLYCFFCLEDHNQSKIHDKDCPYIKAKKFITN